MTQANGPLMAWRPGRVKHRPSVFRPDIPQVGTDRASAVRCRPSRPVAGVRCSCCHRCCQPLSRERAAGHDPAVCVGRQPYPRYAIGASRPLPGSAWRSWRREVMPSLVKTFPRWYSTVFGLRNSWAAISGLDKPDPASRAIWASCGVSSPSARRRYACGRARRWPAARGGPARRTPACRSRRTSRARCAAAPARRPAAARGAATHRTAGGREPARDEGGCGSAGRPPRDTSARRPGRR